MLLEARDEDGKPLSDEAIRDHVLTLLFAGHDTTTATITFLLYELTRNPQELAPLLEELDRVLATAGCPSAEQLVNELPRLDMAVDEVLRMYPPAWIGPRRSVEPFEFAGGDVPGGIHVNYCSWASHRHAGRVPRPRRLHAGAVRTRGEGQAAQGRLRSVRRRVAHLHRHALRADGGEGDRSDVAPALRLRPEPGYELRVRQTPTLGPRNGMPIAVRPRA